MAFVLADFPVARGDEVVDERVAKQRPRLRGGLEVADGVAQVGGQLALGRQGGFLFVGVAGQWLAGVELVFDAQQTGTEAGGGNEIRVGIGRADAEFDALRLGRAGDDAQRSGSIVHAPRRGGRRPRAFHQPRIAVDGRRAQAEEGFQKSLLASDELPHHGAHAVLGVRVVEYTVALYVHERLMHMAALAWVIHRPLGHERGGETALIEKTFREGFEQSRLVRRAQSVVYRDGTLPNARTGFAVETLEREIHRDAVIHEFVEKVGVGGVANDRVAEVAGAERREVAIIFLADGVRRFIENKKLVLERHARAVTHAVGFL